MASIDEACPFCGSRNLKVKPVWKTHRFVACLDCKAGGPVRISEEAAVEAFNARRPPSPNVQGRLL